MNSNRPPYPILKSPLLAAALVALGLLATLALRGCGGDATSVHPATAPSAGEGGPSSTSIDGTSIQRRSPGFTSRRIRAEQLDLPRDEMRLDRSAFGHAAKDGVLGDHWSWLLGRRGSFELGVGRRVPGSLVVRLRAPKFMPEAQTVSAFWNGVELGSAGVPKKPTELRFDVPVDALFPGSATVELVASTVARPSDHVEGSVDKRELALQISSAHFEPLRESAAGAGSDRTDETPTTLAAGDLLIASVLAAEQADFDWRVRSERAGELWVGVHDAATGEVVSWEPVAVGPDEVQVAPDLAPLAGRLLEVSLFWNGAAELDVSALEYDSGRELGNVVLIVVDTLRADHAFGEIPGLETPAFARLIDDGVAFETTLAHAPMTLPSHTSLFSSRYPQVTGVTNNWQPVPASLPLLAEWLTSVGYESRASISLGTLFTTLPGALLSRGFSDYQAQPEIERAPEANRKALPMLEQLAEHQPFFLFTHYSDPHAPYNSGRQPQQLATLTLPGCDPVEVPIGEWHKKSYDLALEAGRHTLTIESDPFVHTRWLEVRADGKKLPVELEAGELRKPAPKVVASFDVPNRVGSITVNLWIHDQPKPKEMVERYAEEVAFADRSVGRILERLDKLDLYDSSLIVFTSDHGESLLEHKHLGHAKTLYDSELHVPLVIKPPKGHPAFELLESQHASLARHIDVVPTVLSLLDLPPLPGQMGSALQLDDERTAFSETHQPESPEDLYALRDDQYKLIYAPDAERFELYDTLADPKEVQDLWSERGAEFDEWRADLETLAAGHVVGGQEEMDEETRERLIRLGYLDPDSK